MTRNQGTAGLGFEMMEVVEKDVGLGSSPWNMGTVMKTPASTG